MPTALPTKPLRTRSPGVVKFVILGDGAVGKTTTIDAFRNFVTTDGELSKATAKTSRTRFVDFHTVRSYNDDHVPTTYSIWDLQGQRKAHTHPLDFIGDAIVGSSSFVILMFALDDPQSFENLLIDRGWYTLIKERIERERISLIFVGNKADRPAEMVEAAVKKIVSRLPTFRAYLAISALTGHGIKELVETIQKYSMAIPTQILLDGMAKQGPPIIDTTSQMSLEAQ